MPGPDERLEGVERKLARLKRAYELFVAGQGSEPSTLRRDLERDLLVLSRQPFPSTAARFRLSGLAHRFRALETQFKNLTDERRRKPREGSLEGPEGEGGCLVLDRNCLQDPAALRVRLQAFHLALAGRFGTRAAPSADALQERLLASARKLLERADARAVRFTLAEGEAGPKIRGEVVR